MSKNSDESPRAAKGRRTRAALLALGSGVGVLLAQLGLLGHAAALVPPCPFHAITGLHCTGCGGTRAVAHLLSFDFVAALHHNPLLVVAAPFLAYYFVIGPRPGAGPWPRWQVVLLIATVVIFTVLRNLPAYPFTLLAPPR